VVAVLALIALIITAEIVVTPVAEVTQFLSGSRWSKRRLFVWLQHRTRERSVRRGYGPRDLSSDSARVRPISIRSRLRADRYPQGMPRKRHDDPPRLVDVELEPTFLGNVFAATHQYILAVYGLRLHSCWKPLLIVLPPDDAAKLTASSGVVLARAEAVIWAVLTCVWAVWFDGTLWKIGWVLGWLTIAYLAYRGVCTAAGAYCDDLRAMVFVHRLLLYKAANFPLPKSTADELRTGPELSGYLDRCGPPPPIKFRSPTTPADHIQRLG
jgi:hypothetical protein